MSGLNWFYDKVIYSTLKAVKSNDIGQEIEEYKINKEINCDVQTIEEKAIKYTWGNEIKSKLQVYCDEDFNIDDVIVYNNSSYRIENLKKWDSYNLYAISESNVEVLE